MEYQNKLRVYRDEIKQYFIHEFAGIGDEIDYYVNVSLPQKWLSSYGNHPVRKINVSDYESTLIRFIENPENFSPNHPLLILIGGAGTGKTTSIKYALSKANVCNGCPHFNFCSKDYPARIHLDFKDFRAEAEALGFERIEDDITAKEYKTFWSYIAKKISLSINDNLPIEEEVSNFWLWLLEEGVNGRYGGILNQQLESIIHLIKKPIENSVELLHYRTKLYNELSREEFAYYKLYIIAYLRRSDKVNCNLLIFDNIDRLQPHFQIDLINLALETNKVLGSKAIIPMRPHTFHLSKDASDCIEIIEHCVPNLIDVFEKRLRRFRNHGDKEVYFFMKKIIESLNSNNTIKEVFHSSAGSSTRFALRNLYNLFLSPLIITHVNSEPIRRIEFDSNIFFQAFFCSEAHSEKLYEANFVNVLSLKNVKNIVEYSNLKLRAIYLLYNNFDISTQNFIATLQHFGYSTDDIITVINEFLDNKKCLMWSNVYSEYDRNKISKINGHMLYITPMGLSYFDNLISHPSYLSECIYSLENGRQKSLGYSMTRLTEVIKLLFDIDYIEIKAFCSKRGVDEYRKMFPSDKPSITSILFYKMYPNFEFLVRNIKIEQFDEYGNFIVREVNTLLNDLEG